MIAFPYKRIFGIIGAPRTGKDTVAKYLQESRDFVPMAFADKIKEEFGISKEDFEAAKIAGNIDELRNKLWEFSATKKAVDPMYFIKKTMDAAVNAKKSVIITDIRTKEEITAFYNYGSIDCPRRIYSIFHPDFSKKDNDGCLMGTQIASSFLDDLEYDGTIKVIFNTMERLYGFLYELENFFFKEDIIDLALAGDDLKLRSLVSDYVSQFNIREVI